MFTLSVEVLGILTAVVAGLLGLIPFLGANDLRRNITAIVVLILGSFFFTDFVFTTVGAFIEFFVTAAVYALVTYKFFLQTIVLQPIQTAVAKTSPAYGEKFTD